MSFISSEMNKINSRTILYTVLANQSEYAHMNHLTTQPQTQFTQLKPCTPENMLKLKLSLLKHIETKIVSTNHINRFLLKN